MGAYLARSLTRVSHEVCSVSDGFVVLTHIEDGEFDLVVIYIVILGMDGLELTSQISVETPDTKVIFITDFTAVLLNDHKS